MMKPMNAEIDAIDILPKNIKILPIPLSTINLSACFKTKIKAFIAEVQKFYEFKAT